ncbi:MAG: enoyl-CoA hydratase [Alphaproteobacteria bacterium]
MLDSTQKDGVCTLTLNRPSARNGLSTELMTALQERLAAIATDASVKVVIIAALGPAFCAGHDLKEIQRHRSNGDGGKAFFAALFSQCTALMAAIRKLRQPVIAQVQGTAVAAGCQLVATCDLAVAGTQARFGVNGINSGFFCSTPAVALGRNISPKKTMELLLTGDLMDADQALEAGLVNQVCAPDALAATTGQMAAKIAAKAPQIISLGKEVFHRQIGMAIDDAYALACPAMVENLMMPDAKEGIEAFLDKRAPQWEGWEDQK